MPGYVDFILLTIRNALAAARSIDGPSLLAVHLVGLVPLTDSLGGR